MAARFAVNFLAAPIFLYWYTAEWDFMFCLFQELFVNEYRVVLADKLLGASDFETQRYT